MLWCDRRVRWVPSCMDLVNVRKLHRAIRCERKKISIYFEKIQLIAEERSRVKHKKLISSGIKMVGKCLLANTHISVLFLFACLNGIGRLLRRYSQPKKPST